TSSRAPRAGVVRLLPAWDTYLLGYRDRGFQVDPDEWPKLMPGGGILRPAIVRDGVVIGQWRLRRGRKRGEVQTRTLDALDDSTEAALAKDVDDVLRFES